MKNIFWPKGEKKRRLPGHNFPIPQKPLFSAPELRHSNPKGRRMLLCPGSGKITGIYIYLITYNFTSRLQLDGLVLCGFASAQRQGNHRRFFPGGTWILALSTDGAAILWLTPEAVMDWLKNAPVAKLTLEDIKTLEEGAE